MTNIWTTESILLGIPAERKLEGSGCLGRHSTQCSHNRSYVHCSHFISLPDEILLCLLTASGTWLLTVPTMPITFLESANHSSAVPKEGTENLNRAQELAERVHYTIKATCTGTHMLLFRNCLQMPGHKRWGQPDLSLSEHSAAATL